MSNDGFPSTDEHPVALDGGAAADAQAEPGIAHRAAAVSRRGSRRKGWLVVVRRVLLFAVAMYVFVVAIQLMKDGAKRIAAHISEGFFPFNNAISTLGLGMLLVGVLVTTLFYLAVLYRPLQRGMLALDEWALGTSRRLAISVGALLVLPLLFMLTGLFAGHAGA